MQHEHISRSDHQAGNSAQVDRPTEAMEQDALRSRTINAQIAADVSRIRSAWLERNAGLTEGSFEDQFVEMLVATLNAHAEAYLSRVDRPEEIPDYLAKLQRLGTDLYNDATQKTQLANDASSQDQLLSPGLRRQIIDRSVANLLSGSIPRFLHSSFQTRNIAGRSGDKIAALIKLAEVQLAKDVERWLQTRDEILFRIETQFAGRYQYWHAEAVKRVREKENIAGPDRAGVSNWEDIEIEFLSEERVQIRMDDRTETRNYAEMGFVDKRNGKATQSWGILGILARCDGVIPESAKSGKDWLSHQKQIARMKKTLQEHFGLVDDPVPFIEATGYRARFKIRRAPSFET